LVSTSARLGRSQPRTPKLLRTEPLKAFVIGAFVCGLSMRDVESLCEQAGLGKLSKSIASRMCEELKERFERFRRRDLYEIRLVALFLDATFISVRPNGPKEGVQVAWGFTEDGERPGSSRKATTPASGVTGRRVSPDAPSGGVARLDRVQQTLEIGQWHGVLEIATFAAVHARLRWIAKHEAATARVPFDPPRAVANVARKVK
jgi:hypothetical protein